MRYLPCSSRALVLDLEIKAFAQEKQWPFYENLTLKKAGVVKIRYIHFLLQEAGAFTVDFLFWWKTAAKLSLLMHFFFALKQKWLVTFKVVELELASPEERGRKVSFHDGAPIFRLGEVCNPNFWLNYSRAYFDTHKNEDCTRIHSVSTNFCVALPPGSRIICLVFKVILGES